MSLYLFAGVSVADLAAAKAWYEKLFGAPPSFLPNDTEAVWDLAEHRSIFIELRPGHAGHARHTLFVEDLEKTVGEIAGRGLEPTKRETYENGVRTAAYHDPDGNEIDFGGAPL